MMENSMTGSPDNERSAFLRWLDEWISSLPKQEIADGQNVAIMVVDMVNGFCKTGNLASDRIGALIEPIKQSLSDAYSVGVRRFIVVEDTHKQDDREFSAFPPHCVKGSGEEETVEEIKSLPFSSEFIYIDKPTLSPAIGTGIDAQITKFINEGVSTFVIMGDCTDLCVYQSSVFLRLFANYLHERQVDVIVPANLVDTYDIRVEDALKIGALPHPGDLMHQLFLYHIALVGCKVVSTVTWGK